MPLRLKLVAVLTLIIAGCLLTLYSDQNTSAHKAPFDASSPMLLAQRQPCMSDLTEGPSSSTSMTDAAPNTATLSAHWVEPDQQQQVDSASASTMDLKGIPLTKENVPEPVLVHDNQNVRLTWEDFQAIAVRFAEYGDAFAYRRMPGEGLFYGEWWVEPLGYGENGEPIFELVRLLSFNERAKALKERVFNYDLEQLNANPNLGEFNLSTENSVRDDIYNQSMEPAAVVCRNSKCMVKVTHDDEEVAFNPDLAGVMERLEQTMAAANPDAECSAGAWPTKTGDLLIEGICTTPEP